MASLYRHLQAGEADHGRLPFRPDCARCEHRLCGRYPEKRLLSHRQQAVAATGLVAASSLLPAGSALASDHQHSGVPAPASPPAVVTDGDDGSGEGHGGGWQHTPPFSGGGDGGEATAPSAPETPQLRPEVEVQVPAPPRRRHAPRRAPRPMAEVQPQDRAKPGDGIAPRRDRTPRISSQQGAASTEDAGEAPGARSSGDARTQRSERSAGPSAADGNTSEPTRADSPPSVHVVAEGECLWSIAERRLGPAATNTQLASYVDQLWRLNAERLGTGNPNLIYTGQRLRTPAA